MVIFWGGWSIWRSISLEMVIFHCHVRLLEGRWSRRWFCNVGVALMDRTRKPAVGCACWRAEDREDKPTYGQWWNARSHFFRPHRVMNWEFQSTIDIYIYIHIYVICVCCIYIYMYVYISHILPWLSSFFMLLGFIFHKPVALRLRRRR